LKAPNVAVRTVGRLTFETSMILTPPSGSTVYVAFGSPSLATTTWRPEGVNVSMSGSAPTVTRLTGSSVVAR
jgi:hypothetical protein